MARAGVLPGRRGGRADRRVVNGRVDRGDGLLPGLADDIESLYVVADARGRGTGPAARWAAVAWLRDRGVGSIRHLACVDDSDDQELWTALGFERDMVCLSLYPHG